MSVVAGPRLGDGGRLACRSLRATMQRHGLWRDTVLSEPSARFRAAIDGLDAAHAEDPTLEPTEGSRQPAELLYARRMTEWLQRLQPQASELLRLAVRGQHLRRWSLPRTEFPAGRVGYHSWRRQQARRQAAEAAAILREVGYDDTTCERVASLIRKENLRRDPEAQALEDTACLVFLQYYFAEFASRYSEDRLITIIRKTWNKMSPQAHEQALALPWSAAQQALLARALAGERPQAGESGSAS